jgi:ferritin-like metal-binding protein YciE
MPTKAKAKTKTAKKKEHTLHDLLIVKLQSLFDTENQLIKALPVMAKKATDPDLKKGFEKHAQQTKQHAARLEQAFKSLGVPAKKLPGDAIRGLIKDAQWVIKNVKGADALDANLIAAAQYVEHYEMAGYGSALAWAKLMELPEIGDLLEMTLQEEEETNEELSDLATSKINEEANEVIESQ